MATVTIVCRENGPYQVVGDVDLLDEQGVHVTLPADGKLFLCRCGYSADKPLCDGTHKSTGFCSRSTAA